MASYVNTSRDQTIDFTKPDGTTVSVAPGETVSLDIDANDPQVRAQLEFGSLRQAEKKAKRQDTAA